MFARRQSARNARSPPLQPTKQATNFKWRTSHSISSIEKNRQEKDQSSELCCWPPKLWATRMWPLGQTPCLPLILLIEPSLQGRDLMQTIAWQLDKAFRKAIADAYSVDADPLIALSTNEKF